MQGRAQLEEKNVGYEHRYKLKSSEFHLPILDLTTMSTPCRGVK